MTDQARFRNSGTILLVGFGGLLLLMTLAGLNAVRSIRATQLRNARIQGDFVARSRQLNQIRSELYLAGTTVRDFLLEPEPARAEAYRGELNRSHGAMEQEMTSYARLLAPDERDAFSSLQSRIADFWTSLAPIFTWSGETRRERGYVFARDEVRPRRSAMLALADQIADINERQLQAGSARVDELFAQARTRLVLTLGLTLSIGFLLALFSRRRVLALEMQASRRLDEVVQARGELKALSARLVEVQELERRAIARELHDEVGQSLSAVLVGLSNLMAEVPGEVRPWLQPHLDTVRKLAEGSVAAVRNIALLLRPSMLDDLGLVPALQWQARETARRTGLLVNVATENVSDDLSDEYKTCVYRVVQEALHNASRHAGAKQVRVEVRVNQDELRLSVQDDGRGFDSKLDRGMGLLGMEERVTNLGGTFAIDSELGRGTLLAVEIPLEKRR